MGERSKSPRPGDLCAGFIFGAHCVGVSTRDSTRTTTRSIVKNGIVNICLESQGAGRHRAANQENHLPLPAKEVGSPNAVVRNQPKGEMDSTACVSDVVARASPLTELGDTEAALAVYRTFFEVARTRDPALFDRLSETLSQQRAQCSAIRRSGHIAPQP